MSRRPSTTDLRLEVELVQRATSAGQGARNRVRQHGELATYQWGLTGKDRANGCRCDQCVEGNRAYKRRYARQRLANRGGGFVALRTVRPHVTGLLALGWQITQIADAARITTNAVRRIATAGAPGDDVRQAVATALLAIPLIRRHRLVRLEIDKAILERVAEITSGRWSPLRDVGQYADVDEWKAASACAALDPDAMYPGRGDQLDACRALCNVCCPVKADCAEAGLQERFGIWGGLSERERRAERRRRGIRIDDDYDLEEAA